MPRPYNSVKRKQLQAELRQRIVEAAVLLHAERGTAATTYRDIAQRADVAVPSVYKHFPSASSLFSACTSCAASRAPRLSVERLLSLPTMRRRISAMVETRCRVNEYFHPWMKWGGDRVIPEVVALMKRDSEATKKAIDAVLASAAGLRQLPKETSRMVALLLNYHSWASLSIDEGLSRQQVVKDLSALIERVLAPKA